MITRILRSRSVIHALNHTTRRSMVGNNVRCLSTFDKHRSVFEALGLDKTGNLGVYDGEWKGSGPIVPSYNPVNNEVIAEVITVSYYLITPTVIFPHIFLLHFIRVHLKI